MTRRSRSPIDPARRLAAAGALDSYERDLRDAITRAGDGGLVDVAWTTTSSPVGELVLAITERGLVAISFGMRDELLEELAEVVSPRVVRRAQALDEVRRELDEYFAGTRHEFDLRLDLALSRGFRRTVLEHLAQLPYGHTTTYAELAAESGSPRAWRAVGSAMATNPIPIVVPCHRVLSTGGGLGGYGGGLDAKRWLLTHEGVPVPR
jgi:methylated-DNA-[protein]-cysteine S-methyltransferase